MNKKLLTTLLSAGLFAAGSASAAVVFSDDFADGNLDGWTSTSPGANNSGIAPISIVDGTPNGLTGNALSIAADGTISQEGPAILLGSTYSIPDTGDFISLSFDFVMDVAGSSTGFFRFDLLDDPDDDISSLNSADGYFGQISSSATDRGRIVQTQDLYYNGTGDVDYAILNTDSGTNSGWIISADTVYSASLTITKTITGADVEITFSGGTSSHTASESDLLGSAFTSFDTVAFGLNADATVLYDNIEVDFEGTVVPEPSTYALLFGLGTLALVMIRRKMRD